jgi:hypothetical protein
MSQINPFRALVVPSSQPQGVPPKKERQQRGAPQQEHHDAPEGEREKPAEDGKPHIDLKA